MCSSSACEVTARGVGTVFLVTPTSLTSVIKQSQILIFTKRHL